MKEKLEELYQQHLSNRLDLVFKDTDTPSCRNFPSIEFKDKPTYLYQGEFIDGVAIVQRDDRMYNLINKKCEELSEIWFNHIESFYDGFAIVKYDNRLNFVDKSGNLLLSDDEKIKKAENFHNGLAKIEVETGWYYIDTNGNKVGEIHHEKTEFFHEDRAVAHVGEGYNYVLIDRNNNVLSDKYRSIYSFVNGVAIVDTFDLRFDYNLIDLNGNKIFDVNLERITRVSNNILHVVSYKNAEGTDCLFDINGNQLSKWYKKIGEFHDGLATVHKTYSIYEKEQVNLINLQGQEICDIDFKKIWNFQNGLAVVSRYEEPEYNLIDKNGKLISDEWFAKIFSAPLKGWEVTNDKGEKNYLDETGKPILRKWYKRATQCEDSGYHQGYYYIVSDDNENYSYIGKNGNVIIEKITISEEFLTDKTYRDEVNYSTGFFDSFICKRKEYIKATYKDLKDYQVRGHLCSNGTDKFKIKYEPIVIYDLNYVLCYKEEDVYLFDRRNKSYTKIGDTKTIELSGPLIHTVGKSFDEKVYLIYDGQLLNITNYYKEKLKNKRIFNIREGIKIIPKDLYDTYTENQARELLKKDEEERKKQEAKDREVEETRKLNEIGKQEKKRKGLDEIEVNDAIYNIIKYSKRLEEISDRIGYIPRLPINSLFVWVDDHREIRKELLEGGILKFADLKDETFYKVKMCGIDFSGQYLPSIKPQEVYNKDLSNCNFEGVFIHASTDFTGVNICGTKFTRDNNTATFDINPHNFINAIYDDKTTLNGEPLTELIKKAEPSKK